MPRMRLRAGEFEGTVKLLQPDQARRLPSPLDASVVAVIALSLLCRYGCPAHRTPSSLVNMLDPTSSRYTPA